MKIAVEKISVVLNGIGKDAILDPATGDSFFIPEQERFEDFATSISGERGFMDFDDFDFFVSRQNNRKEAR